MLMSKDKCFFGAALKIIFRNPMLDEVLCNLDLIDFNL